MKMKKISIPKPLSGIITPMVTPLLKDNSLDVESLNKLIEHLILGGVNGVFILGTTGESTSLIYSLREELIRMTCQKVSGKIPVLVGVSDTAPQESIRLAEVAHEAGAAAVVATPPYYYGLGQPELIQYFLKLADNLPLPLFLYNMPSHTKIMIDLETVKQLSEHPNIIGLKDSSANAVYFNSLLYAFKSYPEFSLLVGPEEILASSVLMGANGGVSGGSNMFPKLYVALYQAAKANDLERVLFLQDQVMEISSKVYSLGNFGSSYLKGLKASLSLLGICKSHLASPLESFNEKEIQQISKILANINPSEIKSF